ncbi:MAG TPA: HAMP domain-containing sensor histidine kinase [Albitalea sp.]|nr:HAMP domain-containing sensor histidine kinase [Albitalea sp.]
MRTLTLRIYLTVVAVLALFALTAGWLFQRHMEQERMRAETVLSERMAAWGELIQRSLPGVDAPAEDQAAALREWSQRLRLPLALDGPGGERVGASELFIRRQAEGMGRVFAIRLEDGRTLWVMRPGMRQPPGMGHPGGPGGPRMAPPGGPFVQLPFVPPAWQHGLGLVVLLVVLFIAVAAGAWPVVRHLTRRLQALKQGMETFGSGQLSHRVEVVGRDELAAVARSFNAAASRIEALVRSHQSLLANASHELRSPLARMKMAVAMLADAAPAQRERLKHEIDTNIAELDALVEEVLLASRLDAVRELEQRERVDLLGLAAEEAARVDATLDADGGGDMLAVLGDERLLRRALRNLLENAKRYGGGDITLDARSQGGAAELRVCDRGPGVPEALRERIFEPFYRLPGHAETAGGVGLGLSLVKQIAERHHGSVRCEAREGGGSCFVLSVPRAG